MVKELGLADEGWGCEGRGGVFILVCKEYGDDDVDDGEIC